LTGSLRTNEPNSNMDIFFSSHVPPPSISPNSLRLFHFYDVKERGAIDLSAMNSTQHTPFVDMETATNIVSRWMCHQDDDTVPPSRIVPGRWSGEVTIIELILDIPPSLQGPIPVVTMSNAREVAGSDTCNIVQVSIRSAMSNDDRWYFVKHIPLDRIRIHVLPKNQVLFSQFLEIKTNGSA
jgi:hypothetical protein